MGDPARATEALRACRRQASRSTTSARATPRWRYLRRFPVDKLKIDRSFVMRQTENEHTPCSSAPIDLGHNLGLPVVAEGVEPAEQVDRLRGSMRGRAGLPLRPPDAGG